MTCMQLDNILFELSDLITSISDQDSMGLLTTRWIGFDRQEESKILMLSLLTLNMTIVLSLLTLFATEFLIHFKNL